MTIGAITVRDTGPLSPFGNGAIATYTDAVPGGSVIIATAASPPGSGHPPAIAATFVPTGAGGAARALSLTDAKSPSGVAIAVAAGASTVGISRTAGASCVLVGRASAGDTQTQGGLWQLNLPSSYVANAVIPVAVNAQILGTGTLNAGSCTLAVSAYTEVNGVEAALTVSNAQILAVGQATYNFNITGTGLVPFQNVAIAVTGVIVSTSGSNTLEINSALYTA